MVIQICNLFQNVLHFDRDAFSRFWIYAANFSFNRALCFVLFWYTFLVKHVIQWKCFGISVNKMLIHSFEEPRHSPPHHVSRWTDRLKPVHGPPNPAWKISPFLSFYTLSILFLRFFNLRRRFLQGFILLRHRVNRKRYLCHWSIINLYRNSGHRLLFERKETAVTCMLW